MRLSGFTEFMIVLIVLSLFGCGSEESTQDIEEILAWEKWLESGMPQAVEGDGPYFVPSDTILYENDIETNPSYSIISDFVISDSVLIVSDNNMCELHAYTLDGELLWTSGQSGEGPGCLSYMGGIDARYNIIAVCNMSLARVDLFDQDDGLYMMSLSIQAPFDVSISEDSAIVAVSIDAGNLVTVFDLQGNVLDSFGSWEPLISDGMTFSPSYANVNLKCDIHGNLLVVSSVFFNHYQVYDLETDSLISSFYREPALPLEQSTSTRFILRNNNCVFNEDGEIVVLLCPTKTDWLEGKYEDLELEDIMYKGFDRFDPLGVYLGGSALQATWDTDKIQFVGNDVYLSNYEMLVKYSRIHLQE